MPDHSDDLQIRTARFEDADALSDILAHSFERMYRFSLGLGSEETAFLLGELYRRGLLPLEQTWVAQRAGRVIGLAVLTIRPAGEPMSSAGYWPVFRRNLGLMRAARAYLGQRFLLNVLHRRIPKGDLAYLDTLAVPPAERSRGIGSALLEHCFGLAQRAGCPKIALHVLRRNADARRLYERLGFTILSGRGSPVFLMVKELPLKESTRE